MTPLPSPRFDAAWVRQITEWLNTNLQRNQAGTVVLPGAISLASTLLPRDGALPCDGGLYARSEFPTLFRTIGTNYNTGGESSTMFRVPNIPAPATKTEWRIQTGE